MSNNGDLNNERVDDFNAVKISLANPDKIREQSKGEVKKAETINYRSYKPERDGLFCERIFGPEKDWECMCGKYRGQKFKGMTCDRCGVQITNSRVRRKRMGHIELAAPVVHIWFFRGSTSRLATLLAMKANSLEKVVYFQEYVVVEVRDPSCTLKVGQLLTEAEFREKQIEFPDAFDAEMGAEAIRKLLKRLDVVEVSKELREEIEKSNSKQRRKEFVGRLKLIDALRNCKYENKPEWMILDVIPVIPPDLRPLVLLESGTFATSDLNDLYRRIINRNGRLRRLLDLNAPDVIVRNEKRMLQQSVDALFDNMRCKRPILGSSNRPLKSLTDMIKGKQGRFRENLLGKRVDYSARSVIAVGPHLRLHQCGLPKLIALELFQPFIIRGLKAQGYADTIKSAKKMIERRDVEVWDILDQVIRNHPVLLNRAPTLHRMGIQAFEPLLVEGNAIRLHPMVCKGFNADFDGDQMAVHLPLSYEAQVEAHTLMLSTNNIFSPASGSPIMSPSQDIVMGCYYITMEQPGMKGEGMRFASIDECLLAHSLGKVHLQAKVEVRLPRKRYSGVKSDVPGENVEFGVSDSKSSEWIRVKTTPGRVIFNQILSDGMPFYNLPQTSKQLAVVISDCHELLGRRATIDLLDRMMRLGFEESTKSGLSFATDDLITPPQKREIIEKAEKDVQWQNDQFLDGIFSDEVRYNNVLDIWSRASAEVTATMLQTFQNDVHKSEEEALALGDVKRRPLGYVNPVYLMAHSGARGGNEQIRQLAGMRGLMAKPNGKLIESPVKANFLEGLTVLEYFSSTHGARKGLSDTALKTADSGYMTRKLADVAQNCVVTMHNCGTKRSVLKKIDPADRGKGKLSKLIVGRVAAETVMNPLTDESLVEKDKLITPEIARKIDDAGLFTAIKVRSPMTCDAELGVCSLCYGMDLSTSQLVEEGMAVGIIAAQSIGEPGTQLTMRTFHIGGVGQHNAVDTEIKAREAGVVKFSDMEVVKTRFQNRDVMIVLSCRTNGGVCICDKKSGYSKEIIQLPDGAEVLVAEGDRVEKDATIARAQNSKLLIARSEGFVKFKEIDEETSRFEEDANTGQQHMTITELRGDRRPEIEIVSNDGQNTFETYQLPSKTTIEVTEGEPVKRGTILAQLPQDISGTQDITTGLPRVQEIFEARRPKDQAVMAQIDGEVEIQRKRVHNKQIIKIIKPNPNGGDPIEKLHEIPQGKRILVFTGDHVTKGQALTDGQLVPHDILAICGEEAVQQYLIEEVQKVYRSQNVGINDKHIEVILAQMLRRKRVTDGGDTSLLVGDEVDKFEFQRRNRELEGCVKITRPGDTRFKEGDVVERAQFDEENTRVREENENAELATYVSPKPAKGVLKLLGITKAAVQSDSFLSAASFQETTKVLTEAALSYKIDRLVGLKENVILGRLIPAGTGFSKYRKASWTYIGDPRDVITTTYDFHDTSSQTLLDGGSNDAGGLTSLENDLQNPGSFDEVGDDSRIAGFGSDDEILGNEDFFDPFQDEPGESDE